MLVGNAKPKFASFDTLQGVIKNKERNFQTDRLTYNAFERDIAVLNVFFGEPSVEGNVS